MILCPCVVKLSHVFKAAVLFVGISHLLASVSIVFSVSPLPCPSLCLSVFERGNIFPGQYYFHKNNTSWFLSACRTLVWIWNWVCCHYNNITSTPAALRRGALQKGRNSANGNWNCFWEWVAQLWQDSYLLFWKTNNPFCSPGFSLLF